MEGRASAINMIEKIITKAYLQEVNSYGDIVKKILQSKKPKVVYFYQQKITKIIIMERVSLETVRNRKREIVKFKNPTRDKNSNEKIRGIN